MNKTWKNLPCRRRYLKLGLVKHSMMQTNNIVISSPLLEDLYCGREGKKRGTSGMLRWWMTVDMSWLNP